MLRRAKRNFEENVLENLKRKLKIMKPNEILNILIYKYIFTIFNIPQSLHNVLNMLLSKPNVQITNMFR